jgi:hypothetical protein
MVDYFWTGYWAAYGAVFPSQRHQAVGKAKQRGLGGYMQLKLLSHE